jgi:hypothetical protein
MTPPERTAALGDTSDVEHVDARRRTSSEGLSHDLG